MKNVTNPTSPTHPSEVEGVRIVVVSFRNIAKKSEYFSALLGARLACPMGNPPLATATTAATMEGRKWQYLHVLVEKPNKSKE